MMYSFLFANDLHFRFEDQDGLKLQKFSAQTMGYNNYNRFVALEDHVTKLKVIPYIDSHDGVERNERVLYDQIFEINVK